MFGSTELLSAKKLEAQARTAAQGLVSTLEKEFLSKARAAGDKLARGLISRETFNRWARTPRVPTTRR